MSLLDQLKNKGFEWYFKRTTEVGITIMAIMMGLSINEKIKRNEILIKLKPKIMAYDGLPGRSETDKKNYLEILEKLGGKKSYYKPDFDRGLEYEDNSMLKKMIKIYEH